MYRALGGGGEINAVALATQITLDISDGGRYTAVRRIRMRGVNLKKFAGVNEISRNVAEGKIGAEQALGLLRALDAAKPGNRAIQVFAAATLVAVMFVLMIGGGAAEAFTAFICCLLIQTGWVFLKRIAPLVFVAQIFSGFIATLIASAGAYFFGCGIERIIFGALLPLFPGLAMILAINDTVNGDLTSGVARGVEAFLTAVGLALGASLGLILVSSLWGGVASGLHMVIKTDLQYACFAMLVSFGSGLVLNAKIKTSLAGALIGGAVYALFLLGGGLPTGVFFASLALAALSETAARLLKEPSTLFLIKGIYPLVPGVGIFTTATLIVQGNLVEASAYGIKTVADLLFMVAGIAVISTLFRLKSYYQKAK